MRAVKSSTSLSVFMSSSWSRSVPRNANLRKVRFLGSDAMRVSSSALCYVTHGRGMDRLEKCTPFIFYIHSSDEGDDGGADGETPWDPR
jgi:hypothetical protein